MRDNMLTGKNFAWSKQLLGPSTNKLKKQHYYLTHSTCNDKPLLSFSSKNGEQPTHWQHPSYHWEPLFSQPSCAREYPVIGGHSPSISKLFKLTYLDLFSNQLNGTISSSFWNLSSLSSFSLASNKLSGSLPPNLGQLLPLIDSIM